MHNAYVKSDSDYLGHPSFYSLLSHINDKNSPRNEESSVFEFRRLVCFD